MALIKTQYLSTTEAELVACPAGKQQAVTTIVFCNVDTTASKTFTLYAVPNGGTKVELLVGNTLSALSSARAGSNTADGR